LSLVLALLIFSFGVYAGRYRIYPYELLSDGYGYAKYRISTITPSANAGGSELTVEKQQISGLLRIRNSSQVSVQRELLHRFIWKDLSSSKDFHLSARSVEAPEPLKECANASRRLVLDMPYGFTSVMHLLEPHRRNNRLVIYHRGHNARDKSDMDNVLTLCQQGFDVILVDMVMLGENSKPTILVDNVGRVVFTNHDQLKYLESDSFNPLLLFLAPIEKGIEYAQSLRNYEDIVLIGISGGGAVGTLYAALDERIKRTYAVAGVAPAFVRFAILETYQGDYEQTHPGLAKNVTDLDMYVLAAYGKSRQYVQIYNQYDPCCFAGVAFRSYSTEVSERVRQLGHGSYDAWLDEKNLKHSLSKEMLLRVLRNGLSSATHGTELHSAATPPHKADPSVATRSVVDLA
jgi:pimeloyl-ACP methyl ester carboxylesterase